MRARFEHWHCAPGNSCPSPAAARVGCRGTWCLPTYFAKRAFSPQALFEVSTLRHWSYYVFACTDAVNFAQQPIENNDRSIFVFFLMWIILSCFFLLQVVALLTAPPS